MYDGMSERKRSCPAVSHNCNRTVLSSRYMVFDKKSMPMVAYEYHGDMFRIDDLRVPDSSYQSYHT